MKSYHINIWLQLLLVTALQPYGCACARTGLPLDIDVVDTLPLDMGAVDALLNYICCHYKI